MGGGRVTNGARGATESKSQKRTTPPSFELGPPRTVLFVDDEPDVRDSHKRLLERRIPGVTVKTCESGQAALALLQRESVDLIVADYRMPGMNGVEFLQAVQRVAPKVPRILFTAYAEDDTVKRVAEDAAVNLFLSKETAPERIAALVGVYLAGPVKS